MTLPKKLYKYRSLEGDSFKYTQAIFVRRNIYLAKVDQFNDPFEGKFRLHSEPENGDAYARILNGLIEKGLGLLASGRVSSNARLCSLSASREDVLMWSHYAAAHTGICIEFDTTVEGSPFRDCKKVEYRPEFNVIEDTLEGVVERAVLVKAKQWEYEEEWRLIRPGEEFVEFPVECVTGVTLGCRISDDDKQWIQAWLRDYPDAEVTQANEVVHDIRLTIDPLESGA